MLLWEAYRQAQADYQEENRAPADQPFPAEPASEASYLS